MKSLAIAVALMGATLVAVLLTGLGSARVLTGSMIPWAVPGDLLITVKPVVVPPGMGKVVIARPYFVDQGERLPPIAHRIVGGQPGQWPTRGDANPEPDSWTVIEVDKVVIARIPKRAIPYLTAGIAMFMVLVLMWPGSSLIDDDDEIGPPPTGPPVLFYWPPDA